MKRSLSPITAMLLALIGLAACTSEQKPAPAPPDTRAADEAAIRAASAEWAKAAVAKDLEKSLSFYADDATLFYPGSPLVTGAEGRRKAWDSLLKTPGLALTFATTKVQVARAGDLAYETGTYDMTSTEKSGKTKKETGKYIVVWRKQANGSWKALLDTYNADQ
jgi:uncharacterized protein (TIGR02246 family)